MFNPFSAITAKLYGVAEPLWRLLRSVAAWIFSDLRHVAVAVLLAGGAYWYFNASGLKAENTELRETLASIEKAQKLARKAQLALNKSISDKQRNIARLTDENETNRLKLASAADAYARRMRWQDHSRTEAGPATESNPAQSGGSPDPDAVILSRADFDILNANTARLMDVKAWGDKLIGEGLADVYQDHQQR